MLKGEGSLGTRLVFYCHTIYCCSISNDAVNPSVQAFKKEDTLDSNLDKELGMHYVFCSLSGTYTLAHVRLPTSLSLSLSNHYYCYSL